MQAVSEQNQKDAASQQKALDNMHVIETLQAKEVDDGGDDEPALPDERLECQATQEELQTQGQGLQSKRNGHGPGTNRRRPGSNVGVAGAGKRRSQQI